MVHTQKYETGCQGLVCWREVQRDTGEKTQTFSSELNELRGTDSRSGWQGMC